MSVDTFFESCVQKQSKIKLLFKDCKTPEQIYQKIIEFGRTAQRLSSDLKTPDRLVPGCQSVMHLYARYEEGKIFFTAESEALISNGLAALLIAAYNGESPETVLKCPPTFLDELGIYASLTPSRSNGLSSLFLKMKQESLKVISK